MFIDTHAHLNSPTYDNNLDQVINRAVAAGVKKIICASSNIEESKKAIALAKSYPGIIYASIGIHPQKTDPETDLSPEEQIRVLINLTREKEVIAIGECGLDYSPCPPGEENRDRKEQYLLFKEQIKIAKRAGLPLIIHSRKAFENTVHIIRDHHPFPIGVFHCYSAGKKGIEIINKLGFYFGVDGNLTYDQGLQNVFREIPIEKILLETDSPLLSPIPNRQGINEPRNIITIAECLATVKKIPLKEIENKTSANSLALFGKIGYFQP